MFERRLQKNCSMLKVVVFKVWELMNIYICRLFDSWIMIHHDTWSGNQTKVIVVCFCSVCARSDSNLIAFSPPTCRLGADRHVAELWRLSDSVSAALYQWMVIVPSPSVLSSIESCRTATTSGATRRRSPRGISHGTSPSSASSPRRRRPWASPSVGARVPSRAERCENAWKRGDRRGSAGSIHWIQTTVGTGARSRKRNDIIQNRYIYIYIHTYIHIHRLLSAIWMLARITCYKDSHGRTRLF